MAVFNTKGVCSRSIEIELDGDTVKSVKFNGGCNGNTQGVAALVKGMKVDEAISRLKGIDCGGRGTSCPDQLAKALEQMKTQKSGSESFFQNHSFFLPSLFNCRTVIFLHHCPHFHETPTDSAHSTQQIITLLTFCKAVLILLIFYF